MNWQGHMLVGAFFGLITNFLFGITSIFELLMLSAFASLCALLPDLDHDLSKGRQLLDYSVVVLSFGSSYFSFCGNSFCIPTALNSILTIFVSSLALVGAYFIFFRFFKPKHRGITHTFVAATVFGALIFAILGLKFAVVGLVGYLSHLVADNYLRII